MSSALTEVRRRAAPSAAAQADRKKKPPSLKRARTFYLFVAPWVIGFVALTVFPLGYAFWLSLTDSDGLSPRTHFVGFDNYLEIFKDPLTLSSLGKTGLFALVTVPLSILAGLLLAVMLNQPLKGRGLLRGLIYLPAVVPPVGAALTFRLIFDRDAGAANGILDKLGANPITWLVDPNARYVLYALVLWGCGGSMIISLAGLQDIPRELLEAAQVDGASYWQSFTRITVPLLSPVILFQVITGMIGSLQSFAPLLLSSGSLSGAGTVPQGNYLYMIHVFAQYFSASRFGYASAMLWMLFAVILLVTLVIIKVSARTVFYTVEPEDKK
ncbi:carbohydrate ABC transporter permease [Kribbella sp. NPDC004536]|uniref:carbohydrate ABC transporter permease n=1 Tax=Kribbella sp. NPDC004536 TaxID=3364106 RepID=UPI00369FCAA1